MTSVEHLSLKLGVDNTAVAYGLRSFKSQVSEAVEGVAGRLALAFSAGSILAGLNHIIQKFAEIKDQAENLGVTTDFFQGLGKIADITNSSLETVQKSLSKLQDAIGKARSGEKNYVEAFKKVGMTISDLDGMSLEDVFYGIADAFNKSGDAALNTTVSMELLGKKGQELVTLLSKGSDEIKKAVDETDKLTESEINQLAGISDGWTAFLNTLEVRGGRIAAGFADILYGMLTPWDTEVEDILRRAANRAAQESASLEAKQRAMDAAALRDAKELAELKRKELTDKTREIDLEKTLAGWDKVRADNAERLARWKQAAARMGELELSRERSIGDRSRFTLDELAMRGSNPAQDILDTESQAKEARYWGNFAQADALTNRALEMRKALGNYLTDSESNPLRSIDEAIQAQRETLDKLGEAVQGGAMIVIPKNGK